MFDSHHDFARNISLGMKVWWLTLSPQEEEEEENFISITCYMFISIYL